MTKISSLWKAGKIQRTARITYDVSWNVILFFLLIGFISIFFIGGIGAGYFASLVKDEPIRSYESMEKDIYNYEETSKMYFDNDVYIGDIKSDLHREEIDLEDVSDLIIQATKATEDQNFDEHNGVVPKAIVRAVMQEAMDTDVKTGGSTLTQQLIKNQLLTNEVSFDRKAKEILLAMRLENFFTKDQILEAYLNIIPYGREASGQNIAGIETAAQGVFGIDAKDVNLPQAAYLAGLPQSPSAYTPFKNQGGIKDEAALETGINRMNTVLKRMYDEEYITHDEYEEALEYDIVGDFTEKSATPDEEYPRLVNELQTRATAIIADKLMKDDDVTRDDLSKKEIDKYKDKASKDLKRNGYRIHSTINKDIFNAQQKVVKDYEYFGPDLEPITKTDEETGEKYEVPRPVQTAAVLRENKTGKVISFVGGRETDDKGQLNFATQTKRSPGSTIKPLLDYAPAMELGKYQPGSPVLDAKTDDYADLPNNYGGGVHGMVSARDALAQSYNIPAAKIYQDILPENPVKEYLEKMGVSTLREEDHTNTSAGYGTMDMKVIENVNAFTTFANEGEFIDGYMIESIETSDGDVIYEHESDPVDVFSKETSYLTIDLMRDVISNGTGSYINSQLNNTGVDWAGKTGTSNDYHDAWFIGTNPNVTFGTWIGYEEGTNLKDTCQGCSLSYSQRNNKLWAELINAAAEVDPDLISPSDNFKQPDGVVEKSYCAISGMKPSDLCEKAGLVKTDLFNEKYAPDKVDDSLIKGSFVTVDGKSIPAGDNTPSEFINGNGYSFNPKFLERNGYDKIGDLKQLYPTGSDRAKWEKIGFPGNDVGDASDMKDDGDNPSEPTSVNHSNNTLTWNKSSSTDVVGYYILRADNKNGNFKVIGHTTSTNYQTDKDGIYKVQAVDYFGHKSSSSNDVSVGDVKDNDDNKDNEKDTKKDDKKDSKQDNKKEKKDNKKDSKKKSKKDNKKNNDDKKDDKNKKENDNNNNSANDNSKNNDNTNNNDDNKKDNDKDNNKNDDDGNDAGEDNG